MSTDNKDVRNSIFAAAKAAANAANVGMDPGQPQPGRGPQRESLGIDLPVADVPLPSRGLVYTAGPLHNAENVAIKAMTAKEEDLLMNRTLVRRGTVITELIKACVLDPDIDVNDMISGDRNALMVAIRITGYGADYSVKIDCPKCETNQDFEINLTSLPIKELNLSAMVQVEQFTNEFRFMLPMTKRSVTYKFLTGKEEEKILQDMEAKKKKGIVQENLITTRLINSVMSIDGNTDRDFIVRFCTNMPARDSLALRKHIDENEPGVTMTHEFMCKNSQCGHQEVVSVPMGPSFFWPGTAAS